MKHNKFIQLSLILITSLITLGKIDNASSYNIQSNSHTLNNLIHVNEDNLIQNIDEPQLLAIVSLNDIQKDMKENLTTLDTVNIQEAISSTSSNLPLQVKYNKKEMKQKGVKNLTPQATKLKFKNMV